MSEFLIVTSKRYTRHASHEAACAEREMLRGRFPDRPFFLHRCKMSLQGASHFPKMVALLRDIMRDGLTRETRDRAFILLGTIDKRNTHGLKREAA